MDMTITNIKSQNFYTKYVFFCRTFLNINENLSLFTFLSNVVKLIEVHEVMNSLMVGYATLILYNFFLGEVLSISIASFGCKDARHIQLIKHHNSDFLSTTN